MNDWYWKYIYPTEANSVGANPMLLSQYTEWFKLVTSQAGQLDDQKGVGVLTQEILAVKRSSIDEVGA